MTRRRYVLPAIAILLAPACASGGSTSPQRTGAVTVAANPVTSAPAERVSVNGRHNLTFYEITHLEPSPWASIFQMGAEQAGSDLGVTVKYESSSNDAQLQSKLIEAAIAEHPAGIAISVADPAGLAAAAKDVAAAKIPLYTLNSGINDYKALGAVTHIGQDEIAAGEGAGERLNALGAKSALCTRSEPTNVGLVERCNGLSNSFKGTVRSEFVGLDTDPAGQEAQITALLAADPDIDAVLGTTPIAAASAVSAVEASGRHVVIGGFDLGPEIVSDIKAGTIAFTVDQQEYLQGYLPIVLMYLQATNLNIAGGGLPILTGPAFVDKSNVDRVSALVDAGTR